MNNTPQTPKQELHEIMVEMFGMIENICINEAQYLQFAEMFKELNINIDRLLQMKDKIVINNYYQRFIRQETTIRRHRLTEEQKRKHELYTNCNCGRYIQIDMQQRHLKTQVHYQGRRNRKYAGSGLGDEIINNFIDREVALQAFIIKHLVKVKNINVDDVDNDEISN